MPILCSRHIVLDADVWYLNNYFIEKGNSAMKKENNTKKLLTVKKALLLLGIAMVIVGIVFLFQSGNSHLGANGSGVTRASTSIKFGGDFYTTSAQYTALAANAVVDLYKIVTLAIGAFFIFSGGFAICVTLLLTGKKTAVVTEAPAAEDPPAVEAAVSVEQPADDVRDDLPEL